MRGGARPIPMSTASNTARAGKLYDARERFAARRTEANRRRTVAMILATVRKLFAEGGRDRTH